MERPAWPAGVTPAAAPRRLRLSSPRAGDRRPAGEGESGRWCPLAPKPPQELGTAGVDAQGGEGTRRGAATVGNESYSPPGPLSQLVVGAGPGWDSPTLGRGSDLFGCEEYLLLREAQAVQVGFEILQELFAHIGHPCCPRNGVVKREGGRKRVLGSALLLGGPHSVDGDLAACLPPSLPSLYWGEKGLFAPPVRAGDARAHRCVPRQGHAPWVWGSIHSPERLRVGKLVLRCFRISRSLSLWISLAMEATWSSTGRHGESRVPRWGVTPRAGAQSGQSRQHGGGCSSPLPWETHPNGDQSGPTVLLHPLHGLEEFPPPPPDMLLGVKWPGARGSGCQILGGRSGRVQGAAAVCLVRPPIPASHHGPGFTMCQGGVVPKDQDLAGVLHHTRLVPVGQRGQMGQIPPKLPQPNPRDSELELGCRA